MCDEAARLPAGVRPLFTTTIGLCRETRRAIRANLRGLPNDSRYNRMTAGSRIVLPVLQQVVTAHVALVAHRHELGDADPARRRLAQQFDTEPAGLRQERHVALYRRDRRKRRVRCAPTARCSRFRGSSGPTTRMPLARALSTTSRWSAAPRRPSRRIPTRGSRARARACARTRRRGRAPRPPAVRPRRGRPVPGCRATDA